MFFGRVGVILLVLEVEEDRLSLELEARLVYLDMIEPLLALRGVDGRLLRAVGPGDDCKKSERTRLELKVVSWSSSQANAIFWSYCPSHTTTLLADE